LQVSLKTRFIEDSSVPADAKVVDSTWRYVNKSGGPDRRFGNNPQLPIVLYDEVRLASQSGLNEMFQISRAGVALGLKQALESMGLATAQRRALNLRT
jgi:hypothetical protein